MGPQGFQVGVELRAGIAVGLRVPSQPAAGRAPHEVAQLAFAEGLVALDADVGDLGGIALGHRECHVDAVAFQGRDGGADLGAVQAPGQVLALEFLLGAVGQRSVEGAPFANANLFQGLLQGLAVELLDANEANRRNDRSLFDDHHHRRAIDLDPNVLVQPCREQGAQRCSTLVVVVVVPDAKWQASEHRARVRALQAFHANVFDDKGIDRPDVGVDRTAQQQGQEGRVKAGTRTVSGSHANGESLKARNLKTGEPLAVVQRSRPALEKRAG